MKSSTYHSVIRRADGVCEGCGRFSPHLEVHHLIARSKTPPGAIRELTEVPELLAAVCRACHSEAESYPRTMNAKLFQALYRRYGFEQVKQAFEAVRSRIRIGFELPEEVS